MANKSLQLDGKEKDHKSILKMLRRIATEKVKNQVQGKRLNIN